MNTDRLYLALLHFPVLNKRGDIVTTSVTNMDIHDISRAVRTYGIERFYIVTPILKQHDYVNRIIHHWQEGYGVTYNPSRGEAFQRVTVKCTLEDVVADIEQGAGRGVQTVATSAEPRLKTTSFKELKRIMARGRDAYLLVFGTGWGSATEVIDGADYLLEPIMGLTDYNHLSVRSAVAIVLDRLLGKR
ncbi:MAG: RNA methyltransferase [Deltaproteobacteria bacterium]|nr:RNA methyltransferase [Deltaproteobacteria bacterium]